MIDSGKLDQLIVLSPDDYKVLGEESFGVPGIVATETIGPFVPVQASGPVIMVHDGVIEPHMGIGHHPHRFNERLFYILEGGLSHDDAQNGITGEMPAGGLARLTEGKRGMLHKEWNDTGDRTRAFILVYETDPVPDTASFALLADGDAPRYESAPGVATKELVGPRAAFPIHGDIRLYTDNSLEKGAELDVAIGSDEGALLFPLDGGIEVDGERLLPPNSAVVPPAQSTRTPRVRATHEARLLVVVHGPGRGLVVARQS